MGRAKMVHRPSSGTTADDLEKKVSPSGRTSRKQSRFLMGIISKLIQANGVYRAVDDGAEGYGVVTVDVPNSYSAADEGKVVENGGLIAQTALSVIHNGVYNTTNKNSVTVNVSGGGGADCFWRVILE